VRAVRERERLRVDRAVGLQRRLDAVGQVVRGERLERHGLDRLSLPRLALDAERAVGELHVAGIGLEHVRRDELRLLDDALGRLQHGHAADDQ
jgi:hypothetical protein